MNFDALGFEQLRNRRSLKWGLHDDCIGMFVAEMDFGVSPQIREVVMEYLDGTGIGYMPDCDKCEIREATAEWVKTTAGWNVESAQVKIVPDVITAARITVGQLTPDGSPVVVPTPAYMAFFHLFPAMGREIIEVPSPVVDGRYELDLDGIRSALESGARTLVLVNPWNPTGRVFSRTELEAIDALMADFPDARVFSDDIHAPLALDAEWIPYASISENAALQTITAIAASKGWNIPGLKSAQIIVSNPDDEALLEQSILAYENSTGSIGCAASVAAYRDSADWLGEVREYLAGNLDAVVEWAERTPGVTVLRPEGTYIAWLDFSAARASGVIPEGAAIDEWLRENAKVALTPGVASGSGYEDYARMVTATPRPVLMQALESISNALQA